MAALEINFLLTFFFSGVIFFFLPSQPGQSCLTWKAEVVINLHKHVRCATKMTHRNGRQSTAVFDESPPPQPPSGVAWTVPFTVVPCVRRDGHKSLLVMFDWKCSVFKSSKLSTRHPRRCSISFFDVWPTIIPLWQYQNRAKHSETRGSRFYPLPTNHPARL